MKPVRRLKTLGVIVLLAFSLITFFRIPKVEAADSQASMLIYLLLWLATKVKAQRKEITMVKPLNYVGWVCCVYLKRKT
jgi:hypothetical protein